MKGLKKLFSFFWDRSLLIFLIIGGLNTIASWAIMFCLEYFAAWPPFWSAAFAFAVCSVPSFYFNRKYSFQSKAPLGPSIARFAAIVTGCFLLSYFLKELIVPFVLDMWLPNIPQIVYILINIVGLQVIFTTLNYIGQRLWAFKEN